LIVHLSFLFSSQSLPILIQIPTSMSCILFIVISIVWLPVQHDCCLECLVSITGSKWLDRFDQIDSRQES
jgi:hypothetical protein